MISMNFDEYQKAALNTAIYPNRGKNLNYTILGMCGESGELANKLAKTIRDSNGKVTEEDREGMISELGDILWFLSATCNELGCDLNEVAERNLNKLTLRKDKGTLKGEDDDR